MKKSREELEYIMGHSNDAELLRTCNIRSRKSCDDKADYSIAADGFATSFTAIEREKAKRFWEYMGTSKEIIEIHQ